MYEIISIIGYSNTIHQLGKRFKYTEEIEIYENIFMIPLTTEARKWLNNDEDEDIIINNTQYLTPKLFSILMNFSEVERIAYIEAEYFGGNGFQTGIVWESRDVILEEYNTDYAINKVLEAFKIKTKKDMDEFDTINLGKFRKTDDWININ